MPSKSPFVFAIAISSLLACIALERGHPGYMAGSERVEAECLSSAVEAPKTGQLRVNSRLLEEGAIEVSTSLKDTRWR